MRGLLYPLHRIELFQVWVNLPARLKMDDIAIRYVGDAWGAPYEESLQMDGRRKRTRVPCRLTVGFRAPRSLPVAQGCFLGSWAGRGGSLGVESYFRL